MLYFRAPRLSCAVSDSDEFLRFFQNAVSEYSNNILTATISRGNIKHQVIIDDHFFLYLKDPEGSVYCVQNHHVEMFELPSNTESDPYIIEIVPLDERFTLPVNFFPLFESMFPRLFCVKMFTTQRSVSTFEEITLNSSFKSVKLYSRCIDPSEFGSDPDAVIYYLDSTAVPPSLHLVEFDKSAHPFELVYSGSESSSNVLQLKPYMEFYIASKPGQPPLPDDQLHVLESSFHKKIGNSGEENVRLLVEYFCELTSAYATGSFYAPFTSICQSSGTGKSRLVLECGQILPVIYGVFRLQSNRGYPEISEWTESMHNYVMGAPIDDFADFASVSFKNTRVGRVLIFLAALLRAYETVIGIIVDNFGKSEFEAVKDLSLWFSHADGQRAFNSFIDVASVESVPPSNILGLIMSTCHKIGSICGASHRNSEDPVLRNYSGKLPFVIVFDEISLLSKSHDKKLNFFLAVRRALHCIPPGARILGLAIGTNADINIFHKFVSDDSLRYASRSRLLPPVVLTCNWNIFKDVMNLDELPLNSSSAKSVSMLIVLGTMGRPLWSSLRSNSLFTVTVNKLQNGSLNNTFEPDMAIWGIRACFNFNSDVILSQTLVRSHMAIVNSVDYSNSYMSVSFPSEPFLAITARSYMKGRFSNNFSRSLMQLMESFQLFLQRRPVSKGDVTEALFNMIVLVAIDESENVAIGSRIPENYGDDFTQNQLLQSKSFFMENVQGSTPQDLKFIVKEESSGIEIVPADEPTANTPEDNDLDDFESPFYKNYHLTTVEKFLIGLFGQNTFNSIKRDLPERTLTGFVNASHCIRFDDNFPLKTALESPDDVRAFKSREVDRKTKSSAKTSLIDRAILRYAFMHQGIIMLPPNYPAFDAILPVLIPRIEGEPGFGTNSDDIFTFIGLQYKSYGKSCKALLPDMMARNHYVECSHHAGNPCNNNRCEHRTRSSDLSVIYKNQIAIYLSATVISDEPPNQNEGRRRKVPRSRQHVDVYQAQVGRNHRIKCIHSKNLRGFENNSFMTSELIAKVDEIIHQTHNPYGCSEIYSKSMITDSIISMQPSVFPEVNEDVRRMRGYRKFPIESGRPNKDYKSENIKSSTSSIDTRLSPLEIVARPGRRNSNN